MKVVSARSENRVVRARISTPSLALSDTRGVSPSCCIILPSTFLRPLAPRALPRFGATMDALTPVRPFPPSDVTSMFSLLRASMRDPRPGLWSSSFPNCYVRHWSTSFPGQVSLLRLLDLPTIPSSTTLLPFPRCSFDTSHQPNRLPRLSPGQTSAGRRESRRAVRGSPLARRLPDRLGRIRFVILRTGRSPPVAPHPALRRRSYFRLQVRNVNLVRTFTSPIQHHQRRTS